MVKWFSIVTAAAALGAGIAGPAQAAGVPKPVAMTFDATPEPAYQNAAIRLAGRAWYGTTGNSAPVQIWFAPTGKAPALISTIRSNARGDFTATFLAHTSGSWTAVYKGSAARKAATRTDAVDVYKNITSTSTVWTAIYGADSVGYGGEPWTSAPLTIPTPTFRVDYHTTCYALEGANVSLAWAGKVLLTTPKLTYNAENESFEATGSTTTTGGAKQGTFTMNNPEGSRCYTDFKIFYPKQLTATRRAKV